MIEKLNLDQLFDLKNKFPELDQVIFSSVSSVEPEVIAYLKSAFSYSLELTHQTPVPYANKYKSPETLGLDRLAAAVGAHELFPGKELLVIDAGTAITFDLVESNGCFIGGNISPGLQIRFRALHEYTSKLPLVDESGEVPEIGRTTEEAICAGVINGMTLEIDGNIETFRKKYPKIETVLTGGDAVFFERRLKNPIFVKFEITLIGLNRILEYNVEKL